MKSSLAFLLLATPVLLLAIPYQVSAQDIAAGAWAGTWKFNLEKSKFPGNPPQADQVTIDPDFTISVQETSSTGKQSSGPTSPSKASCPVAGRGDNVTVIATKVNPYKTTQVWNYNGIAATSYAILSKDGKTQTFLCRERTRTANPSRKWWSSRNNSRHKQSRALQAAERVALG